MTSLLRTLFRIPVFRRRVLDQARLRQDRGASVRITLTRTFSLVGNTSVSVLSLRTVFRGDCIRFMGRGRVSLSTCNRSSSTTFFSTLVTCTVPRTRRLFQVTPLASLDFRNAAFSRVRSRYICRLLVGGRRCPSDRRYGLRSTYRGTVRKMASILRSCGVSCV